MEPNENLPTPTEPLQAPEQHPAPNTMSRRRLVLIGGAVGIALCLVALVVVLISHHGSHGASTADQVNLNHPEDHTYETVVSLNQDGFTPVTTIVKSNTEVFFDNTATNAEAEPGAARRILQSKAATNQAKYFTSDPLATNSEYGYTFRDPGTFRFYDADNPAATLTIIVK